VGIVLLVERQVKLGQLVAFAKAPESKARILADGCRNIANTLKTRSTSAEPHAHLLFEFRQALSAFPFPPLVFSRAPLPDENAIAVRIRNRDFAALHIGGPVDSRYFDTIR